MAEVSINGNGEGPESVGSAPPKPRRASLPLIIVAVLFIVVPFLTWYGTWFGRELSDDEIAAYLADEKNPRHIQHALSRVEEKLERKDPSAKRFYPQVIALTKSPTAEIRKTAAWVMGQDNKSEEFHQALITLLSDREPLVRRNAALQLVRFGDGSGRPELRAMLQPFAVQSPMAGTIVSLLAEGSPVRAGGLLARIRDLSGTVQEFRSPLDGRISKPTVKEGDPISASRTLFWLNPDATTMSDALRALAYVGTKEDLPLIESCAKLDGSQQIVTLADSTRKAIQALTGQ